ncbi:peptidoglycan-binding domain-containing protein [Streptomyces sp. WI04-05B]|uniref:peptidoglycan-binding domain-containing protein n=1 Tax=Streptomyces TaxID=1883 RepID=UPI0029B8FF36|nr:MULTISPECIES: peptidoglycan-binding protein [unclassified Streptomyces]MDX2540567.1 peptidoglycan-binding protein [Streptomyces sp. WI04-05B]MDX2585001.1 peptidoglycan-binding protein [Streptomyces sp. WI04-05A]MDX3749269.1 peptidoglycan-binding protein [Streptomyces sp. AK08-02]
MNDPKGHVCPECGAPRGADNTPSCACAERAADAHLENRSAEAAAAEDFDPLRIRPYVELTPQAPATPASAASPSSPSSSEHPAPGGAAEATMPLPAIQQTAWATDEPATTVLPSLPQPTGAPAQPTYPAYPADPADSAEDEQLGDSSRRPRVLLLGAAGAVVAVLAAGGLAVGMFTYDKPARDNTAAQEVRESVPAATTSAASPTPSSSPTSSASASASPAPAPPLSPTPTLSPAPAAPSVAPSRSATPTQAPTTAQATGTISPAPGGDDKENAPVLRPGDHGDEVLELQLRLRQLAIYLNDTDGVYDDNVETAVTTYQTTRGITADEPGVYDRTTRTRLESETTEP